MIIRRPRGARLASSTSWLALIFSIGTVSGHAVAQEGSTAAQTAAARGLAVDGIKLAKAGSCAEAVDKLDRAEKLHHSPIVLAHLGECQVNLGKVVEGTELLRKMLREPLPAEASPALSQAYERAREVLREAKPRIAGLTVSLTGAPKDVTPTVVVDGAVVGAAVLGVELPQNPGEHLVEVTAPGYLKASARVRLTPGEKSSVALELKLDPDAPTPEPPREGTSGPVPAPGVDQIPPSSSELSENVGSNRGVPRTYAYVAYGVGLVGLGLGLGFGRAAMEDKDSLEVSCPNRACPPNQEENLSSARTKGTVATIGFGLAAAGISAGTVLLILSSSTSQREAQVKSHARRAQAAPFRPRAFVGLGTIRLAADF